MNIVISTQSLDVKPINIDEVLRYAGCKKCDSQTENLLNECLKEAQDTFCYKICYGFFPTSITENVCDFMLFSVTSKHLSSLLKECKQTIVFAATVGLGIDRLISKYSKISPAKAIMFQAIGAERIEALCDCFENWLKTKENMQLTNRFSPGYASLSLETQKDIFNILSCDRRIGLTLNNSLTMSPTKSVTAFIGIKS